MTEMLAVVTHDGSPTGRLRTRAEIHRNGDWHCTRTVWVVLMREAGGPALVLQQRGLSKETWPGLLDASSAGHLVSGDTYQWRELEEEIGLGAPSGPLLELGTRRTTVFHPDGLIDREHQNLWLWLAPNDLRDLRPPEDEIEALISIELAAVQMFATTTDATVAGRRLVASTGQVVSTYVRHGQLAPGLAPYLHQVAGLAWRAIQGERDLRYTGRLDSVR